MKNDHLVHLVVALIVLVILEVPSHAQSTLQIGSVTGVNQLPNCPPDEGFLDTMTCFKAAIVCPITDTIGLTFGYQNPTRLTPLGTIVFFSGGGGQTATEFPGAEATFAGDYLNDGYRVVQVAWQTDWENTNLGPVQHAPLQYSVKTAACRPATFLHYVRFDNPSLYNSGTGMCAQGASAGSAAIVYTLAWYGAATYLDKVELTSGPPLSDIERGCKVTNPTTMDMVTVCPTGQAGCVGWGSGVSVWVQYRGGAEHGVQNWTGDSTCAASTETSAASNANWKAMSIVDNTNPAFDLRPTQVSAWLCETVKSGTGTMNNTAPEGQLFYSRVAQVGPNYSVNAITECQGSEGVGLGLAPDGRSGHDAIHDDMATFLLNRCQLHH